MAKITLNSPDNHNRPPNTGDGTEFGDNFKTVVDNLNTMLTEIYGNTSSIAAANRRGPVIDLSTQVTAFSSANTNTSQTMFTYAVPASTLTIAGQGLFVEAWGNVAGNAASKSVILNIGAKSLSTGSFTSSGVAWSIDAYVFRTGANAQTMLFEGWAGSTRVASTTGTDTTNDTGTITITVVATDASAASANVLGNGLLVQFLP